MQQYYFWSSHNPDQMELGSTKPNKLMWLNKSIVTINIILQLLDVLYIDIDVLHGKLLTIVIQLPIQPYTK